MHDDELAHVPDHLSGGRKKFCVQREEFVRVGVSPQREPIDTSDNLEC